MVLPTLNVSYILGRSPPARRVGIWEPIAKRSSQQGEYCGGTDVCIFKNMELLSLEIAISWQFSKVPHSNRHV